MDGTGEMSGTLFPRGGGEAAATSPPHSCAFLPACSGRPWVGLQQGELGVIGQTLPHTGLHRPAWERRGRWRVQTSAGVRGSIHPSGLPGLPKAGGVAVLKLLWSADPGSPRDPFSRPVRSRHRAILRILCDLTGTLTVGRQWGKLLCLSRNQGRHRMTHCILHYHTLAAEENKN